MPGEWRRHLQRLLPRKRHANLSLPAISSRHAIVIPSLAMIVLDMFRTAFSHSPNSAGGSLSVLTP
jgi:hypothetical protein